MSEKISNRLVERIVRESSKKDDEIMLLQAKVDRLTARGFQDLNWEIERLREDKKRLRRLLRQCQPFVARLQPPILDFAVEIAEELKKPEVDDE